MTSGTIMKLGICAKRSNPRLLSDGIVISPGIRRPYRHNGSPSIPCMGPAWMENRNQRNLRSTFLTVIPWTRMENNTTM